MNQLIVKKLSRIVVAALLAVAIFVPIRALAFSQADLEGATMMTGKLCTAGREQGVEGKYCGWYATYKEADASTLGEPWTTTNYQDTKTAYFNAVANGVITDATSATPAVNEPNSGGSGTNNCADGEVEVSVAINGTDKCVGGADDNPIYDYLRGLIIFLGGAIGLAVVVTIVVAGIQYSSSNGNPQNIAKAKDRLINAVIGLMLYLFLAATLRYLVPQIFS